MATGDTDWGSKEAIGDYALIGSTVNSVIGAYFSAQQSKLAMKSQADLANINARMAEMNAQSVLMQGQDQAAQISQQAGQLKSHQRASMAANGIDLGVGSAAEVQASTDVMKEVDMNTAHTNALMKSWGFRAEETNYRNDALLKGAASNSINAGLQAFTSMLGSAGTVAAGWKAIPKES